MYLCARFTGSFRTDLVKMEAWSDERAVEVAVAELKVKG